MYYYGQTLLRIESFELFQFMQIYENQSSYYIKSFKKKY